MVVSKSKNTATKDASPRAYAPGEVSLGSMSPNYPSLYDGLAADQDDAQPALPTDLGLTEQPGGGVCFREIRY